ncbi:MAG: hypothetical protein Q4Q03_01400 [Bowdeniella nasicola]|nr:hypothetical protein [Bowdeniella nasicola]
MSDLILSAAAENHHLLLLPADVTAEDFQALIYSTFPNTLRQDEYTYAIDPTTSFSGPYQVPAQLRDELDAPSWAEIAWAAHTAYERGDRLPAALAGIDPLWDAHASAPLTGSEERAVQFLVAAARRLHGAVRSGGVVIPCDPHTNPALTLYSPVWLDPNTLGTIASNFLTNLGDSLTDADRYHLAETTMSAYSVYGDSAQGLITIEVDAEEYLPPAIAAFTWAANGAVTYQLRYHGTDSSAQVLTAVVGVIEALIVAIADLAPGAICDDDGFLVELSQNAPH